MTSSPNARLPGPLRGDRATGRIELLELVDHHHGDRVAELAVARPVVLVLLDERLDAVVAVINHRCASRPRCWS
jgi:hypothetical protein